MTGSNENHEVEQDIQTVEDDEEEKPVKIDCCIGGCSGERITPFSADPMAVRIPTLPFGLRQQWVHIIRDSRREIEWRPQDDSVVCSLHFKPNELLIDPGNEYAELDLEGQKLVVPTLRLAELAVFDEDDGLDVRILHDSGVKMTPLIKEEPKDPEQNEQEEEEDPFFNAGKEKKKNKGKRQNKPTWSLREMQLSDDEPEPPGKTQEEDVTSSDFEPSSGSESDGEGRRRKKRRLSNYKPIYSSSTPNAFQQRCFPIPGSNGTPNRLNGSFSNGRSGQQHTLSSKSMTITPVALQNGFTPRGPVAQKFTLSASTAHSLRQPLNTPNKTGAVIRTVNVKTPSLFDVANAKKTLDQLVTVFKSIKDGIQCFKACNQLLATIFNKIGFYSDCIEKRELSKQLNTLSDLIQSKVKNGASAVNELHMTLVAQKAQQLLQAWVSQSQNETSTSSPAQSQSRQPPPALISVTKSTGKPPNNIPRGTTTITQAAKRPSTNQGSSSPEIICIEDEEPAEPSIKISSVRTLNAKFPTIGTAVTKPPVRSTVSTAAPKAGSKPGQVASSANAVRAAALEEFCRKAKTSVVPKPVPVEIENKIAWMSQPANETVYVGYFSPEEKAEKPAGSPEAIPPVLTLSKYQPNVPLSTDLFKMNGVKNPFIYGLSSSTLMARMGVAIPSIQSSPSIPQPTAAKQTHQMTASEQYRLLKTSSPGRPLTGNIPSIRNMSETSPALQQVLADPTVTVIESTATTSNFNIENFNDYDEIIILSDSDDEQATNTAKQTASLMPEGIVINTWQSPPVREDEILGI